MNDKHNYNFRVTEVVGTRIYAQCACGQTTTTTIPHSCTALAAELVRHARMKRLRISIDNPCITGVSERTQGFCATSMHNTLESNLEFTLDWAKNCKVGTAYPLYYKPIPNFSQLTSKVYLIKVALHRATAKAGPGHIATTLSRKADGDILAAVAEFGITVEEYRDELYRRMGSMTYTRHTHYYI